MNGTKDSKSGGSKSATDKNDKPTAATKQTATRNSTRPIRVVLSSNREPTYYIGGGNGVGVVNDAIESLGWRRIKDKMDENYTLRWTELKSAINYTAFREGEQMVNHIPNCQLITNKLGLYNSLTDYSRLIRRTRPPTSASSSLTSSYEFLPETFRLDVPADKQAFLESFKEGDVWICKPTGRNQGKGIFLVRKLDDLSSVMKEGADDGKSNKKPNNRIIQRYIQNPLLLDGKKFDLRMYMLIANTAPFMVFFHQGYVRLSIHEYDNDSENLIAHLTNQFIQKKDPTYKEVKDETTWSMDRFNAYINEKVAPDKQLPEDWVKTELLKTIKEITSTIFSSVKNRLQSKTGYFELYGLDFMIDDNMKIFLIECNINPCLATNCEALKAVVPGVVKEAIYLSVECFDKSRKGKSLLPLHSQQNFELIFDGTKQRGPGHKSRATGTQLYQRRARSLSPLKESSYTTSEVYTQNQQTCTKTNSSTPKATHTTTSSNGHGRSAVAVNGTATSNGERQQQQPEGKRRSMFPSLLATSPYNATHESNVKLKMSHSAASGDKPVPGRSGSRRTGSSRLTTPKPERVPDRGS